MVSTKVSDALAKEVGAKVEKSFEQWIPLTWHPNIYY